jgi:hypothetical protein
MALLLVLILPCKGPKHTRVGDRQASGGKMPAWAWP